MKRQVVGNTEFFRCKYFLEQVALFLGKARYSPTHSVHLYPIFLHDSILYTKLTDTRNIFLTITKYM